MAGSLKKNELTILIVDDERSIVDTLGAVLEIRGFQVREAYSGEMARKIVEERGCPDLIVLDILLPGVNGLDLCRQFKSDPRMKDVPVLMITVITQDSELADGFWNIGTGADDFVTKPFDPFDMADRIEHLLVRRHGKGSPVC